MASKLAALGTIRVGDEAKDSITGYKGIVIAKTEWLNGCARLTIQPQELHDGKPIEAHTFDENQLILIKAKSHEAVRDTGGPREDRIALRR